jgi:pimeloyl-ACP methyl ester carboxylesterase
MPALALAGDKSNGIAEFEMAKELATNVKGSVAPNTGHWLPDENPDFLAQQLLAFWRKCRKIVAMTAMIALQARRRV